MTEMIEVEAWQRFSHSAESVFDAWLDPATAGRWLFATHDGEMRVIDIEPREGGRFLFVERRAEEDAEHFGRYRRIERPQHLHFDFGVDRNDPQLSEVEVSIETLGEDGCELTLLHRFDSRWAAYAERTREGWVQTLQRLEAVLSHG